MFRIYMAGHMSMLKLEESIGWRKEIRNHYVMKAWNDLVFLDPYNGKCLSSISGDGLTSDVPSEAIFDRDYNCVKSADLIIANMNTFGSERVPFGTISEVAWAWQMKKPIIMITQEPQYKDHPFGKRQASWIVPDVKTLLDEKILDYFYQGAVTAKY